MASDGEYLYSIAGAEAVEEEQQPRRVARKKKAVRPSGTLRPIRRRAAPPRAGGGGKRREFMLWRERWVGGRRLVREVKRLSNVRAPPDLLFPEVFLEVNLANNEIVVHLQR